MNQQKGRRTTALREGVVKTSRWDRFVPKISGDPRFKLVPTHNERRSLFEKFLRAAAEGGKKTAKASEDGEVAAGTKKAPGVSGGKTTVCDSSVRVRILSFGWKRPFVWFIARVMITRCITNTRLFIYFFCGFMQSDSGGERRNTRVNTSRRDRFKRAAA